MGSELMKIRWKIAVSGTVHGNPHGVKPGDTMDLPDAVALRYCKLHYAEPVVTKDEEHAVAPEGEERSTPKRGRPPKTAES